MKVEDPAELPPIPRALREALASLHREQFRGTAYRPLLSVGDRSALELAAGFDPEVFLLLSPGGRTVVVKEGLPAELARRLGSVAVEAGLGATSIRSARDGQRRDLLLAREESCLAEAAELFSLVRASDTRAVERGAADRRLGALLGYPACCIDFFAGFRDAGDDAAWLRRSMRATRRGVDGLLIHYPFPFISHVPCSFHCEPSLQLARVVEAGLRSHPGADAAAISAAQHQPLVLWDLDHWIRLRGERVERWGSGRAAWFRAALKRLEEGTVSLTALTTVGPAEPIVLSPAERSSSHPRRTAHSRRRVLLVQPPSALDAASCALPVGYAGVGLLACEAFLRERGFDTQVLHLGRLPAGAARRNALRDALALQPELVAVSMNWVHLSAGALEVAAAARAEGFGGPLVVGGQHASMFADAIAERWSDRFDAVLVGDAEGALAEVATQGLPEGVVAGPGSLLLTPSATHPAIDQLPPISYAAVQPDDGSRLGALSTVRGVCPRGCSYCLEAGSARARHCGPLALRPMEALADQVERFVAEGRDIVTIQDPLFRFGDRAIEGLVQALRGRRLRLRELNLFTEPRALGEAGLEALADAPADRITLDYGVESGAPAVLQLAGRPPDVDATLAEMASAARRGVLVYSWWMVGLPGETPGTVRQTAHALRRSMAAGVVPRWITPALVFPDTPVGQQPERFGVTLHKRTFEDFFPFSTTPASPLGAYPQLITHDCGGLSGLDALCCSLALKRLVAEHLEHDLRQAARAHPAVARALEQRTRMLTDEPDRGFDLGTFF